MSKRNYSNFITAFRQYYEDDYIPNKFYMWSAISLVATALERKCWLPWGKSFTEYPNLYIFYVAGPGVGKSSAIRPAVKMLEDLTENSIDPGTVRMLPNKLTEPKMVDLMGTYESFEDPAKPGSYLKHTSAFYVASEASTCFHDPYGGFAQFVTALYDNDTITKSTVNRDQTVRVVNPCLNVAAGCTFNYLTKLLSNEGVLGGFASRISYVVQFDKVKRSGAWQGGSQENTSGIEYAKLLKDLRSINKMAGEFQASPEFKQAWEEWFPTYDKKQQDEPDEVMQSLMVRKPGMIRKIAMVISAAESDELLLTKTHWDMSLKLVNDAEEALPRLMREGQAKQVNTQEGLNSAITDELTNRNLPKKKLIAALSKRGFQPQPITQTLNMWFATEVLIMVDGEVALADNPNT